LKNKKVVKIFGGLGNQLFQYSLALFLKNNFKKNNILLDLNEFRYVKHHSGFELDKLLKIQFENLNFLSHFKYKYFKSILIKKRVYFNQKNKDTNIMPNVSELENFNYLEGYWQNLELVNHILGELRESLILQKKSLNFSFKENFVAIHIRRGDYLQNQNMYGNICDLNYYKNAIEIFNQMKGTYEFYIFSDDLTWCKENFNFLKHKTYIDFNKTVIEDFNLFLNFRNKILSNSTFSWWASILNPDNLTVICPRIWNNKIEYKNFIPENWMKI
jgi:hypothetical protein